MDAAVPLCGFRGSPLNTRTRMYAPANGRRTLLELPAVMPENFLHVLTRHRVPVRLTQPATFTYTALRWWLTLRHKRMTGWRRFRTVCVMPRTVSLRWPLGVHLAHLPYLAAHSALARDNGCILLPCYSCRWFFNACGAAYRLRATVQQRVNGCARGAFA
jgi:hypothetical protein